MAEEQEDKSMSFLSHLEELRWRLVKSAIAIVVFAIVIFYFTEWITNNIFLKLADPDFPIFRFFCWAFDLCANKIDINWQSVEMTGQFGTNLMMAILGGIVVAFPWIFYQIWSFVKPGLKEREINAVKGIVFFVSILFFMGIMFGYFVIAPLTVQFFGNWQMAENIHNNITINSYLKTIVSTVFFTGLLFLLPVVIMIFTKLGIITSAWLKKYRKHSFIAVLIIAAVITPPDLFTQIVVAIPIVGLYEFGIIISKRIEKKRYNDSIKQ
ncbi:twin-arginine translocase subunit TatC [Paracrocinitomix mangrovi]|uniref:twin-arginine translocase subunit TatC n=1 Tax=Paracrocinitomix mangrovi TaxID=2862509 RepID=UPI001C8F0B8E|nr:twin-arginine translocase subunit TatC [Paracrocinitomix mangrovi]UKN01531.1 twin-arginine translocase subunit TatC [Paracrocinitomix mangrovi]